LQNASTRNYIVAKLERKTRASRNSLTESEMLNIETLPGEEKRKKWKERVILVTLFIKYISPIMSVSGPKN
jgi:hypothetical protein